MTDAVMAEQLVQGVQVHHQAAFRLVCETLEISDRAYSYAQIQEMLMPSWLRHRRKTKASKPTSTEHANTAQAGIRSKKTCRHFKAGNCTRGDQCNFRHVTCQFCNKRGHEEKNCFQKQKSTKDNSASAHLATASNEESPRSESAYTASVFAFACCVTPDPVPSPMSACLTLFWSAVFPMVLFLFMVCGFYYFFDELLVLDISPYIVSWLALPAFLILSTFFASCESCLLPWLAVPATWGSSFLGWFYQLPGYINSSITTSLSSWTSVPSSFHGWQCTCRRLGVFRRLSPLFYMTTWSSSIQYVVCSFLLAPTLVALYVTLCPTSVVSVFSECSVHLFAISNLLFPAVVLHLCILVLRQCGPLYRSCPIRLPWKQFHCQVRPVDLFFASPDAATDLSARPIILDSGASRHIFSSKDAFQPGSLRPCIVKVYTADTKNHQMSTHVGTAVLSISDDHGSRLIKLFNALLVPDMPMHLVSLSCLDDRGCKAISEGGKIKIDLNGQHLVTAIKTADRLYRIPASFASRDLPADTALKPLDNICCDISGPFPITSAPGGLRKLYLALLIDTATNSTWIYFLPHRTNLPSLLQIWLQFIQNTTGKVPNLLFTDTPFMKTYTDNMNRMILQAARSMGCQFAQNPGVIHWSAVKRILWHLTNTLCSNPVKHIDIHWFFIREALEAKVLKVVYVPKPRWCMCPRVRVLWICMH